MATVDSQGVKLKVGTAASPPVYSDVGEVTGIDGLQGGAATVIDVSNLDSAFREKRMGLPDEGQVSVTVNYDPNDPQQTTLEQNRANKILTLFQVTLPTSPVTTFTFSAYVLSVPKAVGVDQIVTGSIVLEITGAVVRS